MTLYHAVVDPLTGGDSMPNIKSEIVELIKQFKIQNDGRAPIDLYISREDEARLEGLGANEIGDELAAAVAVGGIRVVKRFLGLTLHWDSERTFVG